MVTGFVGCLVMIILRILKKGMRILDKNAWVTQLLLHKFVEHGMTVSLSIIIFTLLLSPTLKMGFIWRRNQFTLTLQNFPNN